MNQAHSAPSQAKKLGYLVPEFPGQTHIFFWRELKALRAMGCEPKVISTRLPHRRIRSHDWSKQAQDQTTYLFPPTAVQAMQGMWELLRCGPVSWAKLLSALCTGPAKRLPRRFLLAMVGASVSAQARAQGWSHLHVHSCADAALIAVAANRLSGLPYSVTLHGPLEDYGPEQPLKWRHAAFAVIITQRLLAEARQQLDGSLPDELVVAPMGVELAKFKRQTPYQPWNGQGPARLVSCGRLNRIKGHQELIDAVAQLRQRGIDVRLNICGEDEQGGEGYHKDLQRQIDESQLGDVVKLLGAVSEARVCDEIEQAHMFCLASHHEPLGVAIMEAMAMQIPVVTTDAGGVPELVDHDRDGVLVPPKQPEALANAIDQLLADPQRASGMAKQARQKIETSFHSGVSASVIASRIGGSVHRASDSSTSQAEGGDDACAAAG